MYAQNIASDSTGTNTLEFSNAKNYDIIKTLHKNYPRAVQQMAKHAPKFKGRNTTETARNIYNFLKKEITYKADPEEAQLVKIPGRLVADKVGDCKSYSLFTAAVLGALGKPVNFRYASYTNSTTPSHVYTTTKNEQGKEIIIDAVYNRFNAEQTPTYTINKKMKVYTLSGLNGGHPLNGIDWEKVKKDIVSKGGKVTHWPNIVLFSTTRGAMLILINNNVFGLASKLWAVRDIKKQGTRINDLWYAIGGTASKLNLAISKGYRKKPIFSKTQKISGIYGGIGEAGTITALAASATAGLAAFNALVAEGKQTLETAKQSARDLGIPIDEILNEGKPSGGGSTSSGSGTSTPSTVSVRLLSTGNGTISINPGPYNIPVGTRATVTAKPAPGWYPVWNNGSNDLVVGATITQPGQIVQVKFEEGTPPPPGESGSGGGFALGTGALVAIGAAAYFLTKK
jgi:hypothetical protein